jgi:hypothetical protein
MPENTVKITVEVWVNPVDVKEAVQHLTKAAACIPVVAEQVHVSTEKA